MRGEFSLFRNQSNLMTTKLTEALAIWKKKMKRSSFTRLLVVSSQEDFHHTTGQDRPFQNHPGSRPFVLFPSEVPQRVEPNRAVLGDAHSEELSLQHQCGGEVHAECRQSRLWRLHKRIFETSLLRSLDSAGLDTRMPRRCQIFGCKADVEEGALLYLVFVLMLT